MFSKFTTRGLPIVWYPPSQQLTAGHSPETSNFTYFLQNAQFSSCKGSAEIIPVAVFLAPLPTVQPYTEPETVNFPPLLSYTLEYSAFELNKSTV
jgi:hypothetical protein